jgi:hypothetical protein
MYFCPKLPFKAEVPNFRSGNNGQQVCRRQALHSNSQGGYRCAISY